MLVPPSNMQTREAVLLYGLYGSGKSLGWATLADMYRLTKTPGHFHIISTEWERALQIAESYENFYENCTIHEVEDFATLMEASVKVRDLGVRDDWLVIDSIGNAQTWTRDEYFNANMAGKSYREFLGSGGAAKDVGAAGWIQMDNRYKSWINPFVVRFPGHKFACAQADPVNTEGAWADKGAIRNLFGRIGMKPVGQKELSYVFRSVLLASNPAKGDYELTTVKDSPGREYLTNEKIAPLPFGFVKTFLMDCAGWSITE